MTTAQMLQTLKTRLDEGGFRTDDELYQALTNGQSEVLNFLISARLLTKDYAEKVTYSYAAAVPIADNHIILSARYAYKTGSFYNARVVSDPLSLEGNSLTEPDAYDPIVYQDGGELIVKPDPVAGESEIEYIRVKDIPDINSLTEPTLSEPTHNAIVQWAYAEVLSKDEARAVESEKEKSIFYQMLKAI